MMRAQARGRPEGSPGGFTLVELLIVIVLLVACITSVCYAVFAGLRAVDSSYRSLLAAKGVVEYQLEFLRHTALKNFNDPLLDPLTHASATAFTTPALNDPSVDQLTCSATYTVSNESGNADLKRVSVTVAWLDADGRTIPADASILLTRP